MPRIFEPRKPLRRVLTIIGTVGLTLLMLFFSATPVMQVEAQTGTASACGATYTVQIGDTMYGIAQRCGVTFADLRAANNGITNPSLIFPGQVLNVPQGGSIPTTGNPSGTQYTVQPGDTMSGIAFRYGVTLQALLLANPGITNANLIFPGQVINLNTGTIPSTGGPGNNNGQTYTVQSGDTLLSIAQQFNTTVGQLMQMNPSITNMNVIYPGQVLTVR